MDVSPNFATTQGRRIRKLFAALDLARHGLERVRGAWESGDARAACSELVAYYEKRSLGPGLLWEPRLTAEEHRRAADAALDDVFELQDLTAPVPRNAGGGLDWNDSGPNQDPEWTRFLNRHDIFRSWLRAWQQSGEERYRAAIGDCLRDWVQSVPPPRLPTWKGTWRGLEAARRSTLPWLEVFFCQDPRPALDAEARILMLSSLADHGRVLRRWHARRGNHRFTELVALAVLAAAWPEFRRAAAWLEYAAGGACGTLLRQTYPDGAHVELSNHYHRVVLLEAERLAAVMSATGRPHQHEPVRQRLAAMWAYFAGVTRPDGYGPLNNDGDLEPNAWYLSQAGRALNHAHGPRPAAPGKEVSPPVNGPPSRYFPWAGQAIMRSGFGPDSQWARLDMGPHGTNHQHRDHLSVELFAGGRPFLVDPGRYSYQRGPARDYFRGPTGHNVVLVNGNGSVPPPNRARLPVETTAVSEADYDFFCGSARFRGRPLAGRRGCLWRRAALYLRGRYWIVVDHLTVDGPAEVAASWLFHPDCAVAVEADRVFTDDPGRSNLAVVPTAPSAWRLTLYRGLKEPRMRGWYSESYNRLQACAQAEYRASIRRPTAFAWILFPANGSLHPPGTQAPTAVVSHQGLNVSVTVTLPRGVGEDRVAMNLGGADEIRLGPDIRARGPCAVLHSGGNGSRLIGTPAAPETAPAE
jgi:hypothetical protein